MSFRFLSTVCSLMLLLAGLPAQAGLVSVYSDTGTSNVDANFEGLGGFLQTTYNLPNIIRPSNVSNPGGTQPTVLPQIERAVAQLAKNNANGLHLPTSASGIPGVPYTTPSGTESGVWDALTNHGPVGNGTNGGGSVTGTLPNFGSSSTAVSFTFSRTGNVVSYVTNTGSGVTATSKTWTSAAQTYFADINALEFRIRSVSGTSESLTNLLYNGTQILPDISAANGNVTIQLFEGVSGDFTLTGIFNTSGSANGWNHQIKGLSLPATPVPEPSALVSGLVGVLGCVLAARRRRN